MKRTNSTFLFNQQRDRCSNRPKLESNRREDSENPVNVRRTVPIDRVWKRKSSNKSTFSFRDFQTNRKTQVALNMNSSVPTIPRSSTYESPSMLKEKRIFDFVAESLKIFTRSPSEYSRINNWVVEVPLKWENCFVYFQCRKTFCFFAKIYKRKRARSRFPTKTIKLRQRLTWNS